MALAWVWHGPRPGPAHCHDMDFSNFGDINQLRSIGEYAFYKAGHVDSTISLGAMPLITGVGRSSFYEMKGVLSIAAGTDDVVC